MLRRGGDCPPGNSADAVDQAAPTGCGFENTTLSDLHVRIAGEGVADWLVTFHDIVDPHQTSGIGIDHPCLPHDALREAIQGEGGDGADDGFRRLARDPLSRHAGPELLLHLLHGLLAALEAESAAQFLRLATREARRGHGHAQELLLEERDAERALEN